MDTLQFQKNSRNSSKNVCLYETSICFAGIPAPERQALSKQLLKESHTY